MKYLLLLTILISSCAIMADSHGSNRAIWAAKIKFNLAELKGPPLLADLEVKRANKIADLDLLINSGKYEGKDLAHLISIREKILSAELPSQEQINLRHEKKLKAMDQKLREPNMRDRKLWELRKQKNRRNRKN